MIIGAGPSGLMMACCLAQYGINFRIIDKKSARTSASNAIWIQPRTLEILDQMGMVDKFIRKGQTCDAINLYADGESLAKLSLKHINAIYPFILMLAQAESEKLLEEYLNELNYKVEWSIELIDVKYSSETVTATLKHADGTTESITSRWLIASDGANSLVREKCGLHFTGDDLKEQFIVADATIDFSHMSKNEIHYFFNPETILGAFPLGDNRYRLVANLHLDYPRKIITEHEVIEIVQERAHGKYYVTDVEWISPFWIHSKVAENLQKDNIFLIGDAGHIHSPAGGQGMNMGIQDAYNLAWKLALVSNGKSKPSLLKTYQIERHPIIKATVNQNEYFTKLALNDDNFIIKLKKFGAKLATNNHAHLETMVGEQLTQLDIQYTNSPIIAEQSALTGRRIPDTVIGKTTLYRYLSYKQHNILIFTGMNAIKDTLEQCKKVKLDLENKYQGLVKCHIVHKELLENEMVIDTNGKLHEALQIEKPSILVVRPDTYIAYQADNLTIEAIDNLLRTYI